MPRTVSSTVEISVVSPIQLTIDPHPVTSGSVVSLSVGEPSGGAEAISGAAAEWQCWDGEKWLGTHQLMRDWAERGPETFEVRPGVTSTIPSVGLPVPSTYSVLVPDVPAGIYRIPDVVVVDGEEVTGFVVVEATR